MNFASDNWAGATPEVMLALSRHNEGFAAAYGGDDVTSSVERRFAETFERNVELFFTATGTASNALSMAAVARPGGLIFCSADAHLRNDEYGASEFFTQGMKAVDVPCQFGKINAADLEATLARFPEGNRTGRPVVLSLTNATEAGTLYSVAEVAVLSAIAHRHNMLVHMDGARFANAVVGLSVSPAALTWQAGIDLMSFGGTKNGCWAAEAIVVFEPGKFPDLHVLKSRAGHTFSKARFVAAQFEAYLENGNWLKTAAHANAMAKRLADGFATKARLGWAPGANEVFPVLPKATIARLREAGASFHPWSASEVEAGPDEQLVRLVTAWATKVEEVDRFLGLV
ncbi:MAG TPA: beta-eliminating lyase-related protein [Devosiaceae bacterium]|nr:beta-eliminating lyase-related protein [Devosiaceae bacterium]